MLPESEPTEQALPELASPAVSERQPFWGYVDLAMVIGLMVAIIGVILVAVALAMMLVPSLKADPTPILLPAQLGLYVAIYLALKITFALRHQRPVFTSLGANKNWTPRLLAMVGLLGLALSPAVSAVAELFHTPEVKMDILELLDKSPVILALFGVMAITITPFFEELLFRGFLQPLFSRSLGVAGGIGLTALLFGALHGPEYNFHWQYVAAISLVGAALGAVRYRTGSIVTSSVMHACYNLVAVIALAFKHQ